MQPASNGIMTNANRPMGNLDRSAENGRGRAILAASVCDRGDCSPTPMSSANFDPSTSSFLGYARKSALLIEGVFIINVRNVVGALSLAIISAFAWPSFDIETHRPVLQIKTAYL